ncbi:MAG: GTP cyclohydrolase I [Candidatus Midichloriaceae bacterium]|jgi:GTP cyclohydrolase I
MYSKSIDISNEGNADISEEKAKKAVVDLLKWIGEDPEREGLKDTPSRVIESYREYFSGYQYDPEEILKKTFSETSGYQEMILLKDIDVYSHCEHHMAPIKGKASVAYYPRSRVIGISKIARVVEIYSKRLQIQERLTSQIAEALDKHLNPIGVAVHIQAKHDCMSSRGINQRNTFMETSAFTGCFNLDPEIKSNFFQMIFKK